MQILLSVVSILLILTGIIYLISLKGFFLFHPVKTLKPLFKKEPTQGMTPIKALFMALAGTLGVGNIVGVATALSLGGTGAVFWMLLSAMVAMVLKYAEILLAVKHRRVDKDGELKGGAPYYIKDGLAARGFPFWGKIVSGVFALLCLGNTFTMGSMLQANAVATAVNESFTLPVWLTGGLMAALCVLVVKGGLRKISAVTEKIVPVMTVGFLLLCLAVILLRAERVPQAVRMILTDAFDWESMGGGVVGFLTSQSLRYGVMRGLMSNEAGCGTAPMAHATAQTNSPSEQGVFGLVEVFVDTILLCSITAIAIIVSDSGYMAAPNDGVRTANLAFVSVLGDWAGYVFSIAILCFGLATILCWAHYGLTSLSIFPKLRHQLSKWFPFLYAVSVFVGAVITPSGVWDIADISLSIMTVINLFVLLVMRKEVKEETLSWRRRWGS